MHTYIHVHMAGHRGQATHEQMYKHTGATQIQINSSEVKRKNTQTI